MIRAGFGEGVITPPLGVALAGYMVSEGRDQPATEVYGDLLACVVLLEDEVTRICLIALDVIGVPDPLRIAILDLARGLGLAGVPVLVAATHTHSGPELEAPIAAVDPERPAPWNPLVLRAVLDGTRAALLRALDDRGDTWVHHGEADCLVNVNRRERTPGGAMKGLPWMGQNPDGPVDRVARTVRFSRSGRADIVIAVYGCHPAVLGTAPGISPDLFGPARTRARARLADTRVMVLQGISGDINPIVHPGSRADCERLGSELGDAITAAVNDDVLAKEAGLRFGQMVCSLPTRQKFANPDHDPMIADWITMRGARSANPDGLEALLSGLRIGPVALLGLPLELFTLIGERLRTDSPSAPTLIVTLCDGILGYLPDAAAYAEGGYEVLTTPFAIGADDVLVDAGLALLNSLVDGKGSEQL